MRPSIIASVAVLAVFAGVTAARAGDSPISDREVRAAIVAAARDTAPDRTAGYMVEATFAQHVGGDVKRLCDWVDRKLEEPGARDGHQAAIRALAGKAGGGDGVPLVLLGVCGYYGDADTIAAAWERQQNRLFANPNLSDAKRREFEDPRLDWYLTPPYQFGGVDESPVIFSPWE